MLFFIFIELGFVVLAAGRGGCWEGGLCWQLGSAELELFFPLLTSFY